MRVASKVAAGSGLLVALLGGVLVYHLALVRQDTDTKQNLSYVHARAARLGILQLEDLSEIDKNLQKLLTTKDPDYGIELQETGKAFGQRLTELDLFSRRMRMERTRGHVEVHAAVSALGRTWGSIAGLFDSPEEILNLLAEQREEDLQVQLLASVDRLKVEVDALIEAHTTSMGNTLDRAQETSEEAIRVTWSVVAAGSVLSLLVVLLTIRSIHEPLKRLKEGTRAVAEGKFFYQLETTHRDEFSELAADFNTMVSRLGELEEMKKDFLSHVSHELRTPLVAMQETNQLLLDELPGVLTEKQRRLLNLNLQGGERLSGMIAKLLDLAHLEAHSLDLDLKTQDLASLIRTVAAEFEGRARERGTKVVLDLPSVPLLAHCDGDRVIQVLENLFENAFKFSPRGSAIEIGAAYSTGPPLSMPDRWRSKIHRPPGKSGMVLVTVADQGPGVPESQKEKIFEKFHQLKRPQNVSTRGVGLGLAICREIVEAHGGAIWLADNEDSGSIFFLALPGRAPTLEASLPPQSELETRDPNEKTHLRQDQIRTRSDRDAAPGVDRLRGNGGLRVES